MALIPGDVAQAAIGTINTRQIAANLGISLVELFAEADASTPIANILNAKTGSVGKTQRFKNSRRWKAAAAAFQARFGATPVQRYDAMSVDLPPEAMFETLHIPVGSGYSFDIISGQLQLLVFPQ